MAISYAKFKRTFGDLGITEWVKFNWLSNAGIARKIYNKVVEAGYNPLAYVNDELYNHIEGEKFLILVGSVDLGTLNDWRNETITMVDGTQTLAWYSNISDAKGRFEENGTTTLCAEYSNYESKTSSQWQNKQLRFGNNSTNINIVNTAFNNYTASQVKAALSGVILYYELATPVLIDL